MALLDMIAGELLGPKSVGELGKASGADTDQVKEVVTKAIPLFLSGMYQNSGTKEGALSLAKAMDDHAPETEKSTASMLSKADVKDGKKIVKHLLGDSENDVKTGLAKSTGLSKTQIASMLGQLAPVVLSLMGSHKQEEQTAKEETTKKTGSKKEASGKTTTAKKETSKKTTTTKTAASKKAAAEKEEETASSGLDLAGMLGSALLGGGYQQVKKNKEQKSGLNLSSLAGSLLKSSSPSEAKSGGGVNLSGLLMGLLK